MIEDFFVRAILAGVGVALAAGPLGCFVVWRRMAYFGAALAHSALLGVALGFLIGVSPTIGILALCVCLAVMLVALERQRRLASDTLLGILAHGTLALGVVVVSFMERLRIDLMGYLFGDVLAVGRDELLLIYAMAIAAGAVLTAIWRPLLSATVHEELAAAEGVPVARVRLIFTMLIATVIAIGMKVVGILLIISLLIIPAAAARGLAPTPERMAVLAAAIGALSVGLGLFASLRWDLPAGPAIVVAATLIFMATSLPLVGRASHPGQRGRAADDGVPE
jgi:zinc transport system permease protein